MKAKTFFMGDGPCVMGILNVTPDSFSDGGQYAEPEEAIAHGLAMHQMGAHVIDVGGESSRPGATVLSAEEETERILPVVEGLRAKSDVVISIDTRKASVARQALQSGANWINDISAGTYDPEMVNVAADARAPVILMHMRGTPKTMQNQCDYDDVVEEVRSFLLKRAAVFETHGLAKQQIILDPGLGFAKTAEQNFLLLRQLHSFKESGYPLAIGASRKSFIYKPLGRTPQTCLEGSLAVAAFALQQGCDILRVHDVEETVGLCRILGALQ